MHGRPSRDRAREGGRDSDVVGSGVWFPRWPSVDGRFHEKESLFGGDAGEFPDADVRDEAQGPCLVSNGIVFGEMFALKLENVSDEQLSVLPGHVDKTGMKTVGVGRIGEEVDPQHFERRCKTHLFRQEQGTGENLIRLKGSVHDQADATGTQIDRFLDERAFCRVRLSLKADREGDGDAIVLPALRLQ